MMEDRKPDFGDYVRIEMKRYGAPNEFYLHKVIGRLQSSHAAAVPIDSAGSGTKPVRMGAMQDVLQVVECGVSEDKIYKVPLDAVTLSNQDLSFA